MYLSRHLQVPTYQSHSSLAFLHFDNYIQQSFYDKQEDTSISSPSLGRPLVFFYSTFIFQGVVEDAIWV